MSAITKGFLGTAILYGIAGLALGLQMAISDDHAQMPTHAHINLIGWVSFFLFAMFYHTFGTGVSNLWARVHFWLAQISLLGLSVGLLLLRSGNERIEPFLAASSMAYAASFLVFAVIAYRCLAGR
ncbi:MAG: hypothetical protein K8F25_08025 [Fimbriimonadaceae bacterium]|nr:hypothetical protein [Alphaproteobacteria bacterium]